MCDCNEMIEVDSQRAYNPITRNVEFTIKTECTDCGKIWTYSNVGVY